MKTIWLGAGAGGGGIASASRNTSVVGAVAAPNVQVVSSGPPSPVGSVAALRQSCWLAIYRVPPFDPAATLPTDASATRHPSVDYLAPGSAPKIHDRITLRRTASVEITLAGATTVAYGPANAVAGIAWGRNTLGCSVVAQCGGMQACRGRAITAGAAVTQRLARQREGGGSPWHNRLWARSSRSASISRRSAGSSATARCWRSRNTTCCSTCSARPTAATARPLLLSPTCADARRYAWARAPASQTTSRARSPDRRPSL